MIISLLLVSFLVNVVSCRKFCVKTEYDTQPDFLDRGSNSCATIDQYASDPIKYFSDNAVFVFLPGTHILTTGIEIANVKNLSLLGRISKNGTTPEIVCNSTGGLVFEDSSNVKFADLSLMNCGQPISGSLQRDGELAQAALAFGNITDLTIDSITIKHSSGFGMLAHCVHGEFNIINSTFEFNKGNSYYLGGNAGIQYVKCSASDTSANVIISSSNFTHGSYDSYNYTNYSGTLATGLMMIISHSNVDVTITNVLMKENENNPKKGFGGNLFIQIFNKTSYSSNKVVIEGSHFLAGKSWVGGGINFVSYTSSKANTTLNDCVHTLTIHNTTISNNEAVLGSGIYLEFQTMEPHLACPYLTVNVTSCTFDGNRLLLLRDLEYHEYYRFIGGLAVHFLKKNYNNLIVKYMYYHLRASFSDCTFRNNYITRNNPNATNFIELRAETVTIINVEDYIIIHNCNITDNELTGIGIYNSKVRLSGFINISNNTGVDGGGMILCQSSYIILQQDTNIVFSNNHALLRGGGIYSEEKCLNAKPFCFYQYSFQYDKDCSNATKTVQIVMNNNTAGYAGDHIYGGALDDCKISKCTSSEMFRSLFTLTPDLNDTGYGSAVSSSPRGICFCHNGTRDCNVESLPYPKVVYPGEYIYIDAVIVGQLNGTVPGTLLVYQDQPENKPVSYPITRECTSLKIRVEANIIKHNVVIKLQVSSEINSTLIMKNTPYLSIYKPSHISVMIKPCPPGFNHSERLCQCDNTLSINNNDIICNISNETIRVPQPAWIGYNNITNEIMSSGIIYHEFCPYDYCIGGDSPIYIKSNYTLFDQDSQCSSGRTGLLCGKCKDGYSLSMTTSDCIKCDSRKGIVFTIFLYLIISVVPISILILLNITYTEGTLSGLLFYANIVGSNDYIFFPRHKMNLLIFIISLVNLRIREMSCFYDGMDSYTKMWISFLYPINLFVITGIIMLLCRKSNRIAKLCGGNIVKVLATLFQLCYIRLLELVVIIMSSTTIQYPSAQNERNVTRLVWMYNPNEEFLSWKHIPLVVVGIILGLLILAYTLVLLFVQPLQKYSHLRCLSWVARLKPLIDAYTAPHIIKDHCRYWEGLLLLFRLMLAIVFAWNNKSKEETNLFAITSICILLLTITWSVGGVYKKTYLNVLNASCIFNLAILSLKVNSKKRKWYKNISFALAIATLCIVVLYHIFVFVKGFHLKCKRRKYQALPLDAGSDSIPSMREFGKDDCESN